MIIKLPHVGSIDTLNLPDDFEELVKKSFGKYTECTADEFTHEDKLSFLDNLRGFIHPGGPEEYVKAMIMDEVEYQLDDQGEYPDRDEFYNFEFMCRCFEAGDKEFSPEKPFEKNHHQNTETMKVIAEIIRIVINWAPDTEEYNNWPSKHMPPLCRGKDVHNGTWVIGNYVNGTKPGTDGNETGHYIVVYPGHARHWHEVYTDSIGIYTSREDIEHNKVFEGDILLIEDKEYHVIWTGGSFRLYCPEEDRLYLMTNKVKGKEFRIIGNTFDRNIEKKKTEDE